MAKHAVASDNFLLPNGTFIAEVIAFLIILGIIWKYIVPYIQGPMRERQELIRQQAEDADKAREKLAEAEQAFQSALTEARTEAAKIRENARSEAQRTVEELRAAAQGVRGKPSHFAARPGEKRRLVHRREITGPGGAGADEAGGSMTVVRKPRRECIAERIEPGGIAVVKQIPDDLDPVVPAGVDEGLHAAEIITAGPIDDRPADRLARGAESRGAQPGVVAFDLPVVLGGHDLVDPVAVPVEARRALEAGEKEAAEQ